MKRINYLLFFVFMVSCTSNTIFEKPKDLIPRDTMSLLIQDLMIASSAKYIKNINHQKKINYMPFIYDTYKIDSLRFQNSNFYYTSKIDLYEEIINEVKTKLEAKKEFYVNINVRNDSIRRDSIQRDSTKRSKVKTKKLDSIKPSDKK